MGMNSWEPMVKTAARMHHDECKLLCIDNRAQVGLSWGQNLDTVAVWHGLEIHTNATAQLILAACVAPQ